MCNKCLRNAQLHVIVFTSMQSAEMHNIIKFVFSTDTVEKRPVEQHEEESDSFTSKLSFTVNQSKASSIQSALQDIQGVKIQLLPMYVVLL